LKKGTRLELGRYEDEDDAARAYDVRAWAFGRPLNFPRTPAAGVPPAAPSAAAAASPAPAAPRKAMNWLLAAKVAEDARNLQPKPTKGPRPAPAPAPPPEAARGVGGNGGVLAAAEKAKCQWKSTEVARGSEWDLECDKYFRGLDYGKLWVLYSEDALTKSAKAKAKVARAKAKASAKAKAKAKATTKASGGATVAPDSATVAADPPTKRARKETQQMKESKAQSSNKKARCK